MFKDFILHISTGGNEMHILTSPWMGGQHTICTSPCYLMFYAHTDELSSCRDSAGDVSVVGPGSLKQKGNGLLW